MQVSSTGETQSAPMTTPQGTPPVAEGTAQEKPSEENPGGDEWGKRFAQLTKRERQIIERERAIKENSRELEEYRKQRNLREQDPLEFLKANGLTYDQLTEIMLKKEPKELSPEDRIQKLQEELEKDRQERLSEKQRAEEERAEQAVLSFQAEIKSHVETMGSKYELISANNAYETVLGVIEEHYNQTQEMMDIDEACQLVDNHLENEAKKLLGLNRFKQATSTDRPQNDRQETAGQTKTLTNQLVAASSEPSSEYLSDEESKRRIAAKIRWD